MTDSEETRDENFLNIFRERAEAALQRLRYVLLASAGTSIGFAFVRSAPDSAVSVTDLLWVSAILSWAVSFVIGVLEIRRDGFHKLEEYVTSLEEAKRNREKRQTPQYGIASLTRALERYYSRSQKRVHHSKRDAAQIWAFFIGASLFGLKQIFDHFAWDLVLSKPYTHSLNASIWSGVGPPV